MSNFNLFAAHNQWRPPSKTVVPMPVGGNYSQTTNITIKNGPQGFWGFMGGLFSGLTGNVGIGMPMGGLFGGFGMPMGMPMMGPAMSMNGSIFGMGAPALMGGPRFMGVGLGNGVTPQGASSANQEVNELRQIFTKHTIIDNKDGTYSLYDKNGSGLEKTGTFEELKKYHPEIKTEGKEDPGNKKAAEEQKAKQDKWISDHSDLGLERKGDKVVGKNGNEYEWKDNQYVDTGKKAGSPRQ